MLPRIPTVILLAVLLSSSGCGSKSGSSITDPGGGGGGGGTPTNPAILGASSAFAPVHSGFITPNAPMYASVSALASFIPTALGGPAPQSGPSECRLAPFFGTTFGFNGSSYAATELSGAPANGVRFLIYPLDAQGAPVLGNPSGHLDLACSDAPTLSPNGSAFVFSLYANSVAIASATVSSTPGNTVIVGTLTNAAGSTSIPFTSQLYEQFPGDELESLNMGPASAITVRHTRSKNTSNSVLFESFEIAPDEQTPQWILDVEARADLNGSVAEGGLLISGPSLQRALAACISGTLGVPVFTPQQVANCNYTPNNGTLSITNSDAAGAQDIHRSSRRVFELVRALARSVHQPLPPS